MFFGWQMILSSYTNLKVTVIFISIVGIWVVSNLNLQNSFWKYVSDLSYSGGKKTSFYSCYSGLKFSPFTTPPYCSHLIIYT